MRVLVIDDDPAVRKVLGKVLRDVAETIVTAEDGIDGIGKLKAQPFDVVLTDVRMPRADGFAVLDAARAFPKTHVVVMTGQGDIAECVSAIRAGAANYISKPFSHDDILAVVKEAMGRNASGTQQRPESPQIGLLGDSAAIRDLLDVVDRVARTNVTVLLHGETGTGKEVVARLLHSMSDRVSRPFVPVNCGAIPDTLIESELFGHSKGAFTGAADRRVGKFGHADGGTLFLDEIGELPPAAQVKLLRVLQDRVVTPLGDETGYPVDVRVVVATHRDLEQKVSEGSFRADLFYRLNVVPIEIPPLRQRRGDIPVLVAHFLDVANRQFGRQVTFAEDVLELFAAQDWPGNVRELEHVVERLVVTSRKDVVTREDLPARLFGGPRPRAVDPTEVSIPEGGVDLPRLLADLERRYIDTALKMTDGNKNQAAALLKLNRTTLVEKLKRLT